MRRVVSPRGPFVSRLTVVLVVLVALVVWGCGGDQGVRTLAGAEMVGVERMEEGAPYAGRHLSEMEFKRLRVALDVASDGHGGLWLLTVEELAHFDDRRRMDARSTPIGPHGGAGALTVTPDGSAMVAGEPWVRLSPSPGGVKAGPDDLEFGEVVSLPDPELPFEEASMSFSAAGELLVSSLSDATIAAVGADGSVRYLLAPEGSPLPAPVRFPHAVRTSVVALADGRVAFATNAIDGGPGDGEVYVLEGEVLRRVETGTGRLVRRIFPGPDGSLLALDGRNISLLDPDTGEVEVLVDLTELDYVGPPGPRESPWLLTREAAAPDAQSLEPAASSDDRWLDGRIAATADGDDLLFTAGNRLWRLEDAFV